MLWSLFLNLTLMLNASFLRCYQTKITEQEIIHTSGFLLAQSLPCWGDTWLMNKILTSLALTDFLLDFMVMTSFLIGEWNPSGQLVWNFDRCSCPILMDLWTLTSLLVTYRKCMLTRPLRSFWKWLMHFSKAFLMPARSSSSLLLYENLMTLVLLFLSYLQDLSISLW